MHKCCLHCICIATAYQCFEDSLQYIIVYLIQWSISNVLLVGRQCVHKFSIAIARSELCAGNLDDCCQYHCLCKRNCIVDIASVTCVHYLVDNIAQLFAIIYTVINTLQSCAAIKYRLDIFLQ